MADEPVSVRLARGRTARVQLKPLHARFGVEVSGVLVVVGRVVPGGQGERNGIMEGDVLCEINGQRLDRDRRGRRVAPSEALVDQMVKACRTSAAAATGAGESEGAGAGAGLTLTFRPKPVAGSRPVTPAGTAGVGAKASAQET